METSVVTSNNITTTVQNRGLKARSEEDGEYEDDDTSIKRIKIRSKQESLEPFPQAQSILFSNKLTKRSKHSPLDTSSSNLKINDGNIKIQLKNVHFSS